MGAGLGSRNAPEVIERGVYKWQRIKIGMATLMVVLAQGLTGPDCLRRWRALGLSAQAIVIGIGPTPLPPEVLPAKATGAMHMSIWELLDVDDDGRLIIDRERFEQEVDEFRSERPKERKPTSIQARQHTQVEALRKELHTRLADARKALLDKDGARAEAICMCLRSDADLADIIGVNRSTLHRWRTNGVPGMASVDLLIEIAHDLEALRKWQP